MSISRRSLLLLSVLPLLARAQTNWREVAVPSYSPQSFAQGLVGFWFVPRANDLLQAAEQLVSAFTVANARGEQQRAWQTAIAAWHTLNAVAIGPLVERRSARRIDFRPTRVEQIERAIARSPKSEADMESIGSAAKGFAALQWLLFDRAAPNTPDSSAYRLALAHEIQQEARALKQGFESLSKRLTAADAADAAEAAEATEAAAADRTLEAASNVSREQTAVALMNEAVNQWVGGVEQLRMQSLERPLHTQGISKTSTAPADARAQHKSEVAARWRALQATAVFSGSAIVQPGNGLVPLETYLRGLGRNPLADQLRQRMRAADQAIDRALIGAAAGQAAALKRAASALTQVKNLAENDLAPALDIRVGFSDADGD